ncbi:MAG: hypothetical protein EAZ95_16020 [Bacteroidetes bacterium]|nr:MAG: hypothetical protein EAZ95_16020 [Bacteroidota bacterium]
MLSLTSKQLSDATTQHLQTKQDDVNGKNIFSEQVKRAESLWGNKKQNGKEAFEEIETALKKLGKPEGICHYCEHNHAKQIEHIYPKSLFPHKTFVWENCLYICGDCNKSKWNWCKVFYPANSTTEKELKELGIFPSPTEALVFINLREENPLEFIMLDLAGKTFHFLPISNDKNSREYKKARYTIDLLKLNLDEILKCRRNATENFLNYLKNCVKIQKTKNFEELETLVESDFLPLDRSQSFQDEKERLFNEFKNRIQTSPHPTVWEQMKLHRELLPTTNKFFEALPEALQW